jgi:hypothetical protein
MIRHYRAQRRRRGYNSLGVGVISVGSIYDPQDRGFFHDRFGGPRHLPQPVNRRSLPKQDFPCRTTQPGDRTLGGCRHRRSLRYGRGPLTARRPKGYGGRALPATPRRSRPDEAANELPELSGAAIPSTCFDLNSVNFSRAVPQCVGFAPLTLQPVLGQLHLGRT